MCKGRAPVPPTAKNATTSPSLEKRTPSPKESSTSPCAVSPESTTSRSFQPSQQLLLQMQEQLNKLLQVQEQLGKLLQNLEQFKQAQTGSVATPSVSGVPTACNFFHTPEPMQEQPLKTVQPLLPAASELLSQVDCPQPTYQQTLGYSFQPQEQFPQHQLDFLQVLELIKEQLDEHRQMLQILLQRLEQLNKLPQMQEQLKKLLQVLEQLGKLLQNLEQFKQAQTGSVATPSVSGVPTACNFFHTPEPMQEQPLKTVQPLLPAASELLSQVDCPQPTYQPLLEYSFQLQEPLHQWYPFKY